jgi:hypothetical protein
VKPLVPPGYVELVWERTRAVVGLQYEELMYDMLSSAQTAYSWAAEHPKRLQMQGRLPVYIVPFPDEKQRVAVRRNCHGGLFGSMRGDRFVRSRAPIEALMSRLLAACDIETPEVVAYVDYRVNALERRTDVITRALPNGLDFGEALLDRSDAALRADRWRAVTTLLQAMAANGFWHPDLNVKNIYLIEDAAAPPRAAILDVDRVVLYRNGQLVAMANARRLARSLRKWQRVRGAIISKAEFDILGSAAAGA